MKDGELTDWQFFVKWCLPKLWRLYLPVIYSWGELPDVWPEARKEGAAGLFDPKTNMIIVRPEHLGNWAVLGHEYGHWLFYRLHLWLDAAWEIPWWAMSGRRLFITRQK